MTVVCGQDTVQRRVITRGRWYVVQEVATGEIVSGGFANRLEAVAHARELGEVK